MDLRRQSFLGQRSWTVIRESRIAVIGLCGGGSHVAQQLAHIGFSNLVLVDHDHADSTNINRMVGLSSDDVAAKALKVDVIRRQVLAVNPKAAVEIHDCVWQECQTSLKACDLLFGCVDSYQQREQLERFCRRYLIPYIDIGMDVHGDREGNYFITGQVITSLPGCACMRCMGFLNEDVLAREAAKYGDVGGNPQVVWPNGALASTAVGQAMALLTPWNDELSPPLYIDYDGNRATATPNKRLEYVNADRCPHFEGEDSLGDVDW